jgi:hypothetical protein
LLGKYVRSPNSAKKYVEQLIFKPNRATLGTDNMSGTQVNSFKNGAKTTTEAVRENEKT